MLRLVGLSIGKACGEASSVALASKSCGSSGSNNYI
jgi:hypothetical protein